MGDQSIASHICLRRREQIWTTHSCPSAYSG